MLRLTDFAQICRLCLKKHEENCVNLFTVVENGEEVSDCRTVADVVKLHCRIEIDYDHLPQNICNDCWSVVSSMQKLQLLSINSSRILNNILNSNNSNDLNDRKDSEEIIGIKIEFVDTVLEDDSLAEPVRNSSPETNKTNKKKKGGWKKYSEKKISCEVCGKLVPSNLIEYHLNVHRDIRPYMCEAENCGKAFTSPDHVKQHFRKVHVYSITRPYKCDICGTGFMQTSALTMHRSYHFDPELPCTICGQLYRNKRALQRHSLVHSNERKFTCSECKKSFQTRFTLKTHMRIHTLEKPFHCDQCPKSFAYKCLLKAHLEKYHQKESG